MITIINEKSSQAKNFAAALSGMQGMMPSSANLAGRYAIDYAAGHLVTFKPLKEMVPSNVVDDYLTWDYNRLPFDRTKINWQIMLDPDCGGRGAKFYMDQFKRDLARSDTAIIATDLDPSGEGNLIGWEILNYCHFQGDVYRCEHADETANGIITAFTKLKLLRKAGGPINDPLYRKAQARTKFDFLTIQYSRIITDESKRISILAKGYVPRSGRLKSAMLDLIGDQEKLHDYFKPHSDFQPVLYDQDQHRFTPSAKADKPFYKTEAEATQHLSEVPQDAVSIEVETKDMVQKPPKMLNLSQVAARLANKGYSSKKVEALAEKLYRAGILSYPRTDDNCISADQLRELLPLIPKICQVVGIDQNLLDTSHYRSYLIGNGSHGANRPGLNVPNSLDDLRNDYGETAVALYDELARSFLAGFGSDKLAKKHIYADDKTKSYFASYLEITDPGFSLILHEQKEKSDNDEDNKTPFTVGQALKPGVWEKKAVRPALATQAKVSAFLRKNNIGTGATQLGIFNDITDSANKARQLVAMKNKSLRLTKLGQISYLAMYGTALASSKTTKKLEEWLNDIMIGKLTENQFLVFFDKMISHDKRIILDNHKYLVTLPKVKQTTHQKISGIFKPTGEKVSINDGYGTYTYTKAEVEKLFNGEEITFPYGKAKVTGKLADRGEKYGFGFKGQFVYPKADKATGYSALAQKDVSFNKTFAGHTFTQGEIDSLLDGNAVSFAAKSKAGKKYTARVHLENSPLYKAKTDKKVWHIGFVKR